MSNACPEIHVKNSGIVRLPSFSADDGSTLSFAEANIHVPFEIRRIYYIQNFLEPRTNRGGHAHRALNQLILCVSGEFSFHLDDGSVQQVIAMHDPTLGVLVGPYLWHDLLEIKPGTVVLSLTSDLYDESDYIRNYQDFLRSINE